MQRRRAGTKSPFLTSWKFQIKAKFENSDGRLGLFQPEDTKQLGQQGPLFENVSFIRDNLLIHLSYVMVKSTCVMMNQNEDMECDERVTGQGVEYVWQSMCSLCVHCRDLLIN